jgi:putative tricarboxylic transport membrane protein
MITALHDSDGWQHQLEDNGWSDLFQTGDEFASFLADVRTRVEAVLLEIGIIE